MAPAPDRLAVINGLRDLADFLDTNPDVPAPWGPISIYFYPLGTDEEIRAQVDHVARLLGSDVDAEELALGHYSTAITFGIAEYKAVGILTSSRARWAARTSYEDSINLDTDPTNDAPGT
ncbi:hypothetical protein [Sphaerisporangium perillae]|uniref:hypothetical protein n=1 Tax=Sphaerisporangium perillae TaxID=2935860 RepID=UPI00200DD2C3|nr:hypothetical protein [Sphaerisporangium perillae]